MLAVNPKVTNVIFREIGKGSHNDEAVFQGHWTTKVKADEPASAIIERHAKNPHPTKNGKWPNQRRSELSVEISADTNVYLIRIDPDTRAAFGPEPDPIMVLPRGFGEQVLSDVGLVYVDAAGTTRFMAAADIPTQFDQVPTGAMLTFTCDRVEIAKLWKSIMPQGHEDMPINIPFYLNLYDTRTKAPVWTYQPAGRAANDHVHADKYVETHGGIHPSEDPHGDNPIHFVTHGGIHPGSPSQSLY